MDHRLQGRDSGNPPMEVVERAEMPSRKPHQQVVPHSEYPDEGEVGNGQDTSPVSDIAPRLRPYSREAGKG